MRNGEGDPVNRGSVGPEIEIEAAFVFQRVVENALAGRDLALPDFLGGSVGNHGDGEPGLQQADSELQARLPCSNDGDVALRHIFCPSTAGVRRAPFPNAVLIVTFEV
ncbi:hypothetical protein [Arthrobacter sp. ISL-28]|uniref:hypothetical protein n=1 Tax=Arthrobacter sp. ISL-28 TaxID=2819108 RepID=UPI0020357DC4|nr:hypothetical protein [Arthrobacter sp. ISL-28]